MFNFEEKKAPNKCIRHIRGDTLRVKIKIFDIRGIEYKPVEGDIIKFAIKENVEDITTTVEKEIPWDTCTLHLEPEDTKPLKFKKYFYDIQIQLNNGDVFTVISNIFEVLPEVG